MDEGLRPEIDLIEDLGCGVADVVFFILTHNVPSFIDLRTLAAPMAKNGYGRYLLELLTDWLL